MVSVTIITIIYGCGWSKIGVMHLVLMVRVSLKPGLGNNTAMTVPTKAEVRVCCVCCYLVCGLLELTFVEENLL